MAITQHYLDGDIILCSECSRYKGFNRFSAKQLITSQPVCKKCERIIYATTGKKPVAAIARKENRCLKCDKTFHSKKESRLCYKCKKSNIKFKYELIWTVNP